MSDTKQSVEAIMNKDTVLVHELFNEAMMGIIADRLEEKRAEISRKLFEKKSCNEEDDMEDDDMEDLEESDMVVSDDGHNEAPVGGTKKAPDNKEKGSAKSTKTVKSDDGRVETQA